MIARPPCYAQPTPTRICRLLPRFRITISITGHNPPEELLSLAEPGSAPSTGHQRSRHSSHLGFSSTQTPTRTSVLRRSEDMFRMRAASPGAPPWAQQYPANLRMRTDSRRLDVDPGHAIRASPPQKEQRPSPHSHRLDGPCVAQHRPVLDARATPRGP